MEKVSLKVKFSYGIGSLGSNVMFAAVGSYLLIFYTDVFGIGAAAVGTLFFIARILDAVFDPVMGIIVDKTNTKIGKFRPFIISGIILASLFFVLCFTAPDVSPAIKVLYAYITYTIYGLAYSWYEVPYWSMAPTLTYDPDERTKIVSLPRIFGSLGMLLAGAVFIPFVSFFGGGDDGRGYQITAIIIALISLATGITTFVNVKEKIVLKKKEKKDSLRDLLNVIIKNKPLLLLLVSSLFGAMPLFIKLAVIPYYFKYVYENENLVPLFMLTTLLCMIIGMIIIPVISARTGKKNGFVLASSVSIAGSLAMLISGTHLIPFLISNAVASLGVGFILVLASSMQADTVDYAEWKTGKRSESIVFATGSFVAKLALAIGGAVTAFGLASMNYIPNVQQTAEVISGLHYFMTLVPAAGAFISIIPMLFYNLSKEKYSQIRAELDNRQDNR